MVDLMWMRRSSCFSQFFLIYYSATSLLTDIRTLEIEYIKHCQARKKSARGERGRENSRIVEDQEENSLREINSPVIFGHPACNDTTINTLFPH
jgi:hypothetical protein